MFAIIDFLQQKILWESQPPGMSVSGEPPKDVI